jgi:hypothetical protein
LATSRECIDEPSGSGAMELVRMIKKNWQIHEIILFHEMYVE